MLERDLRPRCVFFWILAGACQIPWVGVFAAPELIPPDSRLWAAHLISAVAMFFVSPKSPGWFDRFRPWGWNGAFFVLFLPVIGWALCGALFFAARFGPDTVPSWRDEEETAANGKGVDPEEEVFFGTDLARELDLTPLTDVLSGNDAELKRDAVEKLSRLGTPEAIAELLSRRGDPSPELRFYVTSALTRLKKDLEEALGVARSSLRADPDNAAARLHLAGLYLRYARSGLLDGATADGVLREARHHLESLAPGGSEAAFQARLELAEMERAAGDWQKSLAWLDRDPERPESLKKRAAAFFHSGDYVSLVAELRRWREAGFSDPEWDALVYWWSGR